MMLSCRKATQLMSQELDRQLSWRERIQLNAHVMMCSGCTNFRRNLDVLCKACSQVVKKTREGPGQDAPDRQDS
jgi:predicted amidophosphoribosyltransferase